MTGESDLPPDLATRADELLHTTPALAPIVGTARVLSATSRIMELLSADA